MWLKRFQLSRWSRSAFVTPIGDGFLVLHNAAQTGVASVAVLSLGIFFVVRHVMRMVRMNVPGRPVDDMKTILRTAYLFSDRHGLGSDGGDRQTHKGKTCRSEEKERVRDHKREIALFRSCGNRSGAEILYQFVKLIFSKASHYDFQGDMVRSGFRWIPRNGQRF